MFSHVALQDNTQDTAKYFIITVLWQPCQTSGQTWKHRNEGKAEREEERCGWPELLMMCTWALIAGSNWEKDEENSSDHELHPHNNHVERKKERRKELSV